MPRPRPDDDLRIEQARGTDRLLSDQAAGLLQRIGLNCCLAQDTGKDSRKAKATSSIRRR
jgi:hypothetical protein